MNNGGSFDEPNEPTLKMRWAERAIGNLLKKAEIGQFESPNITN